MPDPEPRYVGGYALRERVAASASGETFRARDGAFGREVAVKLLNPRLAGTPSLVRALEAKARRVMRLDHPAVASLLDLGSDDGVYFVVTEFVHGRSLDRIVHDDGPLSVNLAVETAAEVASALHAGHALGLVHGSLRLDNIMHTLWGETKLTGFGIVPGGGREGADDGSGADMFAVGAALAEMLTGEPSSVDPDGGPRPPSSRNPDVPPEVDEIVARAMAPGHGAEGFGSVLELGTELRKVRGGHLRRLVWGDETRPPAPIPKQDGEHHPLPAPQTLEGQTLRRRRRAGGAPPAGGGRLEEEGLWTGVGERADGDGSDGPGETVNLSAGPPPAAAPVVPGEVDLGDVDPFEEEGRRGAPGPPAASEIDLGEAEAGPFGPDDEAGELERGRSAPAASDIDLGDARSDPFEEEGRTATDVLERRGGNGTGEDPAHARPEPSPGGRQQVIDLRRGARADEDDPSPAEVVLPGAIDGERRARAARSRRVRAVGRWARRAVAVACILVVADFAYTGATVVSSLREAGEGVRDGISHLRGARYAGATAAFSGAADASDRAVGVMGRPSYVLAGALPWLGNDAGALRSLAEGSRLSAVAGETATDAIVAMGAPEGGPAAAVYRNGKVQFDALEIGSPLVEKVRGVLEDASAVMAAAPDANLSPIGDAVSAATDQIEGARETAAKIETLTDALPSLFGRGTARRYLLAFQSPSESRGSGGAIAFYGILETKNGRIDIGEVRPVDFLGDVSAGGSSAPGWFKDEYGTWDALEGFEGANFSPAFSVVAPVLAELYESAIGVGVDGVVGMDPTALGRLSNVTGPIRRPGYGVTLDAASTARVLNHDVYLHFAGRPQARDSYVAGVIEEFWRRMSSPSARVSALASSLPEAISSQHFKVYSRLADDERALVDLEADGDYRSHGPSVQTVFHNNLTNNKIDYFLERRIDTAIRLGTDGRATVTTEAVVENNAVPGPSSDFLGPGNNPSTNRMRLSFLLPQDARVLGYAHPEGNAEYDAGREGGYPLVSENIRIAGGDTVGATVHYTMPIPRLDEDGGTVRFTMFPHATVRPDGLALEITAPDGYSIATPDGPGAIEADGSFGYAGSAAAPMAVELRIVPD